MRVDVSFKYVEKSNFISNILENNLKKIERRIKIFKRDDPIHVSVHIEKNPHKEQYFCRSHIYLPSSKVVVADEKGANVSVAVNRAFNALSRQLNKVKYRLERHLRHNKASVSDSLA
jgi:ribosomal subunit interface protein